MRQKLLIFGVLVLVGFLFYSYRLIDSTPFIGDLARDFYDLLAISRGDIRLIGPKLSFGGLYAAPWYYYLFSPVYWLFSRSFSAVLHFNALLHSLVLGVVFWLLSKKFGIPKALLAVAVIAILPLYLFSARNPGNGFTYQPFLILWFVYYLTKSKISNQDYVIAGFTAGLITSFHIIVLLIFLPAWLYLLIFHRKYRQVLVTLVFFSLPFAPLMLFEATHNFVMIKNTFIDKSYLLFTQNLNIPERAASPSNLFANFWFINRQLQSWLVFGPLVYLVTTFIISYRNHRELFLVGWGSVIYLLFALLSRYQFAFHYLLPLGISIFIIFILSTIRSKIFYVIFSIIILFEFWGLAKIIYPTHAENYRIVENRVEEVKQSGYFNPTSFNIVDIAESGRSTIGQQYRYFFALNNLSPRNEYEYGQSKQLLVFAPANYSKSDLHTLNNYEVRQFGYQHLKKAIILKVGSKKVYIMSK